MEETYTKFSSIIIAECRLTRVLSCGGGGGGGEASTPNSLASTPNNFNCNTNYYGLGPT